jgi:hypothetical protein
MSSTNRKRLLLAKHNENTEDIVENSFWLAIERVGLLTSREYISYMRGWPIRFAFETMCNKLLPYAKENEIRRKVEESYAFFKSNLETYCKMHRLNKRIRSFLLHPENIRMQIVKG